MNVSNHVSNTKAQLNWIDILFGYSKTVSDYHLFTFLIWSTIRSNENICSGYLFSRIKYELAVKCMSLGFLAVFSKKNYEIDLSHISLSVGAECKFIMLFV